MKRQVFCDVCGSTTEHVIDDGNDEVGEDEGGELALCTRCGRLHSLPGDPPQRAPSKPAATPPCPSPCRDR